MNTSSNSTNSAGANAPRAPRPLRPIIAIALVALVVVVIAATILLRLRPSASVSSRQPALAASQTLSLALYSASSPFAQNGDPDVSTLDPADPALAQDSTAEQLVHLLFDGLVTLDATNNLELWGADHVSISPDDLTYTFHIRAGQFFSDGTSVKPSDYAWSLDRVVNPCAAFSDYGTPAATLGLNLLKDAATFLAEQCGSDHLSPVGAFQTLVGDSILPDDSAGMLTLVLAHPAAYFLNVLALPSASVVDRRAMTGLGADGAWALNLADTPTGRGGSGMFYVAAWDHTGKLTLKPNPHWWGVASGKRPHFTEVDVTFYEDTNKEYLAYKQAPSEYLNTVPSAYLADAATRSDYHVAPELFVNSVAFNWRTPPFDNPDVRQAFCLALNRDAITPLLQKGVTGSSNIPPLIPSWHLVPQGMPGYDSQLTGIDGVTTTSGDLAKAQAHWQAYLATLHGAPIPTIKVEFNLASFLAKTLHDQLIAAWTAAFPQVAGHIVDYSPYPGLLQEGDSITGSILRFGWLADYPDPQDFLSQLYSTGAPYNTFGVSVASADALMASADSMSDPSQQAARMSAYHQAEQDLIQQVATCPLYQSQRAYLLRPYVVGLRQTGLGLFPNDDWVTGYIAKH